MSKEHREAPPKDISKVDWLFMLAGSLKCWQGDWRPHKTFDREKRAQGPAPDQGGPIYTHADFDGFAAELTRDRGEHCLFFQRVARMSFKTAEELEQRASDRREAEKDRDLTRQAFHISRRSFRISIGALIVSIVVSGLTLLRGCKPAQMEITKPVQIAPTPEPDAPAQIVPTIKADASINDVPLAPIGPTPPPAVPVD